MILDSRKKYFWPKRSNQLCSLICLTSHLSFCLSAVAYLRPLSPTCIMQQCFPPAFLPPFLPHSSCAPHFSDMLHNSYPAFLDTQLYISLKCEEISCWLRSKQAIMRTSGRCDRCFVFKAVKRNEVRRNRLWLWTLPSVSASMLPRYSLKCFSNCIPPSLDLFPTFFN